MLLKQLKDVGSVGKIIQFVLTFTTEMRRQKIRRCEIMASYSFQD